MGMFVYMRRVKVWRDAISPVLGLSDGGGRQLCVCLCVPVVPSLGCWCFCSPHRHTAGWQTHNLNLNVRIPGLELTSSPQLIAMSLLQPPEEPEVKPEPTPVEDFERTPSGRIRRTSAQVAVFHLQEIAEDELARDWTKRRMKDDLVPETKRVGGFAFSLFQPSCTQRSWKGSVALGG